jgi:hypothetical protein
MTFEEFKKDFEHQGESVMSLADQVQRNLTDDPELKKAAQRALNAEDAFEALLDQRGFIRG